MNVYLIIGNANTGKSSVIQHLVGFPYERKKIQTPFGKKKPIRNKKLETSTSNIIISFYTDQSLQEISESPKDFVSFIGNLSEKPTNLILALRLKKYGRYPDAVTYITFFNKVKWTIIKSVVLDDCGTTPYPNIPNVLSIRSRKGTDSTNKVAAAVRKHFDWI